jgi:prefoldin subunit 5
MEMNIIEQNRALQALVEKLDKEIDELSTDNEKYQNYIEDLINFIKESNGINSVKLIAEKIDAKNGKKHLVSWASEIIDEWID